MRSKWILSLMALILVLGLAACSDDDDPVTPPTAVDEFALVADIGDDYFIPYKRPDGGSVNTDAAAVYATMIDADLTNDYFIVDWRSSAHYANGHIEGAVNMALADLVDNLAQFPTDKVILNVCYSGQTASTATSVLNMLGMELGYNAINLKFGMHGWTYQGNSDLLGTTTPNYPMEDDWVPVFEVTNNARPAATTPPEFDTGERQAVEILKARADAYLKGQMNQMGTGWNKISDDTLWDIMFVDNTQNEWFIVNYFPAANYDAGHVPGAVRYQPNADLASDSFLKTLPTDKKILVYCWTGQTSAQVTAYLNILGYETYSLLYGVQDLCYTVDTINDHAFTPITDPMEAYPVVTN